MICAIASRLSSITTRTSSVDSSRMSEMPSIVLSLTSSAMCLIISVLLTMYGISVMTIRWRSPFHSSISARPRTQIWPRPSLYIARMPFMPQMIAPVGKSGPFTNCIRSSTEQSRWSM